MLPRTPAEFLSLGLILGFALGGSFVWSFQPQAPGNHWYDVFTAHAPDWLVALFTGLLAVVTYRLVQSTNKLWEAGERQTLVAEKAANAAQASADAAAISANYVPVVERAYLTGGGPIVSKDGLRCFRVEVANYGKTPAFLHHFDVHFATVAQVTAGARRVDPRFVFDDRIAANNIVRPIASFEVPDWAEVVYGAFYYQDWMRREHIFRFILRVAQDTFPVIDGVDESYNDWD